VSSRMRRCCAVLAATSIAMVWAVVVPGVASAGTSTNNNACFTGATATYSNVDITMSGNASPDPATFGTDTITLTDTTVTASFSASLFLAGYRLFILQNGANNVTADVTATVVGANTVEGTFQQTQTTTQVVTINDPTPANRSSGDESALPLDVTLTLADSTWTPASGGTVDFKQGSFSVAAQVGVIPVTLGPCNPGTATGCDGTGSNCTSYAPADPTPFEVVTISGGSTTTAAPTTTGASTTTTTTAAPTTTTTIAPTTTAPPSTTVPVSQTRIHGSATTVNACRNSVTLTYSDLLVTVESDGYPQPHLGDPIQLSRTRFSIAVPGGLFVAGYNIGLIQNGDDVPSEVELVVSGSNTRERSHTYAGLRRTASISITDPDGTPGTGDERAQDIVLAFNLPNTTWRVSDANRAVSFRQRSVFVSASVDIGAPDPLTVTFECEPGTSVDANGDGQFESFTPSEASPFLTLAARASDISSTTTTVPPTTAGSSATTQGTTSSSTTVAGGGGPSTTVAGRGGTLPFTGPRGFLVLLTLSAVVLELGYALWSATRPLRIRRLTLKE
jgi:hypothetical protein